MRVYRTIQQFCTQTQSFQIASVEKFGITNRRIYRNLSVPELYEIGCQHQVAANPETGPTQICSQGALVAYSGRRTGRSPKDKRVVKDNITSSEIWWGPVNIPISPASHNLVEQMAINYLNTRERLYVVDGYVGWDPRYRLKIRVLCARVYHALFMRNMLIVPTQRELETDFSKGVDFHIFNAGDMFCTKQIQGVGSETCVSVDLTGRKMSIIGSQYAGEMKKGIFGVTQYVYPRQGILTVHASCNEGPKGDTTILFGLSGTGKTTLSADPKRKLIGDDEHAWTDSGVFNIEGGCYAKCIDLSPETEPDIYNAIKFGSVVENVKFHDEAERDINYHDTSITENTRCSYPLEFIKNVKLPAIGGHPKNIIFLTCDSFGVLPPVSRLTPEQAMYHFISGYTAKVAGTEVGIIEPVATFSSCFGEAFLPLHPTVYAEMLAKKMKQHNVKAWLINTGWTGGKYGVGHRFSLKHTRSILDAIHDGHLDSAEYSTLPVFNLQIPKTCPNVPPEVLNPKNTWQDKNDFDVTLKLLGGKFAKNFEKYSKQASEAIRSAGPQLN